MPSWNDPVGSAHRETDTIGAFGPPFLERLHAFAPATDAYAALPLLELGAPRVG